MMLMTPLMRRQHSNVIQVMVTQTVAIVEYGEGRKEGRRGALEV
jgi:hypothetical protein